MFRMREIQNAQKLDIYLPEHGDGPFPVICPFMAEHSKLATRATGRFWLCWLVSGRGYAVVSINYRLSWEAIFPAQIHDVKTAVRWIRANAEKFKLNPAKIAAWGGSAGGHLSALLGTSGDVSGRWKILSLRATRNNRAGYRQSSTGLVQRIF
jgi:acetyl esterase/lipase